MKSKLELMKKEIGNDILINCHLVNGNIRNAFLIQPADYQEVTSKDTKTAMKIRYIKVLFPKLVLSDIRGETLISKRSYTEEEINSDEDMGKIIGYPCAEEYQIVRLKQDTEQTVNITIFAYLENDERVDILAYACLDDRHFKSSEEFAEKAEKFLKKIDDIKIKKVVAEKQIRIPLVALKEKLIFKSHEKMSSAEIYEIDNEISNRDIENLNPDYTNPVHRGMIIALLSLFENDPCEHFYPLQYRPEHSLVEYITKLLERDLIDSFALTAK